MKYNFEKGQVYSAQIIDEGDVDNFSFLYLGKLKDDKSTGHFTLLDPEYCKEKYSELYNKLINMSVGDIYEGILFDIHDNFDEVCGFDEYIVVYDEINGKLETCLGFEVINIKKQ